MMGSTHTLGGIVLAAVALPVLNPWLQHPWLTDHGFGPVTGWAVIAYLVAAAGGALLPDLDHPHATAARSCPPISWLLAAIVSTVSGGHRNGTHSMLGVVALTAVSAAIGAAGGVWLGLWCGFLFCLAAAGLHLLSRPVLHTMVCLAATAGLVTMGWTVPVSAAAVTVGVFIGALSHVLTDLPTKEGCPLLWPLNRTRFKLGNITTDSWVETWLIAPALSIVAMVVLITKLGPVFLSN